MTKCETTLGNHADMASGATCDSIMAPASALALRKSYSFWRPIQNSALVPKYRLKRKAVSGEIARRP